jgi:hypothetical protein
MCWKGHDVPVCVLLVGYSRSGVLKRLVGLSHMERVHNRVLLVLTLLLERQKNVGLLFPVRFLFTLLVSPHYLSSGIDTGRNEV